jgi:predicted DNA-binding transcriptional regulator AlpA
MRPGDLLGFAEIVEFLGVAERSAARYVSRPDFPDPFVRLAAGPVWLRADVNRWAKKHLPLPRGAPRTSRPAQ